MNFRGVFAREKIVQSLETPDSGSGTRVYHYLCENDGEKSRVHLRIDPDEHGTLIVNASHIMHLNPTAALMAWLILEGKPQEERVKALTSRYAVGKQRARVDLSSFNSQLEELIRPDGACPIHELDLDTTMPFSARPSAPYRMDLAITYRCNNNCAHCYNIEHPSLTPSLSSLDKEVEAKGELSTEDWKRIIDRTWELGIPHVVFTGGEPTLRRDLPELVSYAEANGQISGLNTNARRLSDEKYVQELLDANLDHVQITVESCDPDVHDIMVGVKGAYKQTIQGLKNVLSTRLYVMTNTTMLRTNVHTIPDTLDFLADLGVPTVGLNALIYSGKGSTVGTGLPESDLFLLLETARAKIEAHGQKLIWYTPTQYCHFNPVQLGLGIKGCTAALYNMCVEPDGAVIPCQSYYRSLGNLLADPWDSIWNHKLAIWLRERQGLPEKCTGCELQAECGGGCPLQFPNRPQFALTNRAEEP